MSATRDLVEGAALLPGAVAVTVTATAFSTNDTSEFSAAETVAQGS